MNEEQAQALTAVLGEIRDELKALNGREANQLVAYALISSSLEEFAEPLGKLITKFMESSDIQKFFKDEVKAKSSRSRPPE